jgi:xanthine dehydrogenase YagT iron-sulfur-binding subunit
VTVFSVNGQKVDVELDTRDSLLEVLQDRLGLFGTKKGCDQGQCGVCTVHLDGRRVVSCLTLAMQAEGRDVRRPITPAALRRKEGRKQ